MPSSKVHVQMVVQLRLPGDADTVPGERQDTGGRGADGTGDAAEVVDGRRRTVSTFGSDERCPVRRPVARGLRTEHLERSHVEVEVAVDAQAVEGISYPGV